MLIQFVQIPHRLTGFRVNSRSCGESIRWNAAQLSPVTFERRIVLKAPAAPGVCQSMTQCQWSRPCRRRQQYYVIDHSSAALCVIAVLSEFSCSSCSLVWLSTVCTCTLMMSMRMYRLQQMSVRAACASFECCRRTVGLQVRRQRQTVAVISARCNRERTTLVSQPTVVVRIANVRQH